MFEVNWLVNRMHVSTPRMQVLMELMDRMGREQRTDKSKIEARRRVYRTALRTHRANGDIVRRYRF